MTRCRYPQSSRTEDTAALVFELAEDPDGIIDPATGESSRYWKLVATNPEHPIIMERDAVRRMRR